MSHDLNMLLGGPGIEKKHQPHYLPATRSVTHQCQLGGASIHRQEMLGHESILTTERVHSPDQEHLVVYGRRAPADFQRASQIHSPYSRPSGVYTAISLPERGRGVSIDRGRAIAVNRVAEQEKQPKIKPRFPGIIRFSGSATAECRSDSVVESEMTTSTPLDVTICGSSSVRGRWQCAFSRKPHGSRREKPERAAPHVNSVAAAGDCLASGPSEHATVGLERVRSGWTRHSPWGPANRLEAIGTAAARRKSSAKTISSCCRVFRRPYGLGEKCGPPSGR